MNEVFFPVVTIREDPHWISTKKCLELVELSNVNRKNILDLIDLSSTNS